MDDLDRLLAEYAKTGLHVVSLSLPDVKGACVLQGVQCRHVLLRLSIAYCIVASLEGLRERLLYL